MVLGVMFTKADTSDQHAFDVSVKHCPCGDDQAKGRNITQEMLHPLPHASGYYPGGLQ